jgi:hypothetical protein
MTAKKLMNYFTTEIEGKKGTKTIDVPLAAAEVFDVLNKNLHGKFYSLGSALAYKNDIKFIECNRPDSFFASLMADGFGVNWKESMVRKNEFFQYCLNFFERRSNIYHTPQYPKIKDVIYCYRPELKEDCYGYLDKLVSFWKPFSEIDRVLMKAAILTPGWGGLPGKRPCFIIESDRTDNGRGIGKTEFVDTIINIYGNTSVHLTFKNQIDFDAVKTRILSGGRAKRILRIDNVKADCLDSDSLEDFITLKEISGRELYHGEGSMPNYFTAFITLNGGDLSSDLSQRVIRIKLSRPEYKNGWDVELNDFINNNREALVSEIINTLKSESKTEQKTLSRFGFWQNEVLAKLDSITDFGFEINKRQNEVNHENVIGADFLEFLQLQINDGRFFDDMGGFYKQSDTNTKSYLITPSMLSHWFRAWPDCPDKNMSNRAIKKKISDMNIEGLFLRETPWHGNKCWVIACSQVTKYTSGFWVISSLTQKNLPFMEAG